MKQSEERTARNGVDLHRLVVLFCLERSHYKLMPECDCYDCRRDARNYSGDKPVIAHPPCRKWSRLAPCSTISVPGEKELGPWAIAQVRRCGGVLEHPAGSKLFDFCGCPKPGKGNDEWGGYTILVDQYHWGHKAAKPTCLYIVGTDDLPEMPHRAGEPTHCITQGKGVRIGHPKFKPRITDWERMATPPAFGLWLVEIAKRCSKLNDGDLPRRDSDVGSSPLLGGTPIAVHGIVGNMNGGTR